MTHHGSVDIGSHQLTQTSAPFVIAEAGVNHNGDPKLAHELVEAAADAGAQAVKFQTFDPALLVRSGTATAAYQQDQTGQRDQRAMLESLALPASVWPELLAHSSDCGIVFLSTPFDHASLEQLVELGVPALKASSADLTNHHLLRAMRSTGLPLLLSTGASDLAEVEQAVDAIGGDHDLVLFHCVTAYPADPITANLRSIVTMAERFSCPVGWSDHTSSHTAAIAATALGANVFERHLTLDRGLPGPDHQASDDPTQFADYVRQISVATASLGDGTKRAHECEVDTRALVRRGLYAARDLEPGTTITAADVVALRPVSAIDATVELDGRTVATSMRAGEPFTWDTLV